jgi:hypothetical protein
MKSWPSAPCPLHRRSSSASPYTVTAVHPPPLLTFPPCHTQTNAFRCGVGFCLFAAVSQATGGSAVYNISWTDASVQSRTPFPGAVIHNLHMDADTGDVVTVVQYTSGRREVAKVQEGQLIPVLDITAAVGNGTIHHGGTTHCRLGAGGRGGGGACGVGPQHQRQGEGPGPVHVGKQTRRATDASQNAGVRGAPQALR